MKKLCILLSIVCLCSFMLTSCTPINNKEETTNESSTNESSTEVSELTKEEKLELEKTLKTVEEKMIGLLNAKTEEEISQYVTEVSDRYVESLLESFPYDDYVVKVEKLGEYNHYDVFYINAKRESEEEFSSSGIELFKMTDKGYLVETNEEFLDKLLETKACPSCSGSGYIVVKEGDCPVCKGTGMEYKEKAVYDKETKTWSSSYVDCSACQGTGEANGIGVRCETCDGKAFLF